jgi:hypothetical protein
MGVRAVPLRAHSTLPGTILTLRGLLGTVLIRDPQAGAFRQSCDNHDLFIR